MAERLQASLGVGGVLGQRGEDDSGGSEHDRERARPVDADAQGARLLVAGARGYRDAVTGLARHLGRLEHRRQPLGRHLERVQHLVAPAPSGHVEEERAGCVAGVGRLLAGEAQAHVVLREEDVSRTRVELGLVAAHPDELRRRVARERAVAGQIDEACEARAQPRSPRTPGPSAGRSRGSPGGARARSRRGGRARASDRRGRSPRRRRRPSAARAACVPRHQSSGSCSAQPGRGVSNA